ncbi:SET and MYND domain-containing protein 4 isoform X2 [Orussus abietinus]|uniref:SET and MYND domain-containing protein 4 isoform X2 n=1 Tax=Orussus abietinus TaxID=222816 RepID=UPI0006251E07|nr:SET and MYND domain-containing protein 4 isoform X2 [Orussus abietinus]
MWHKSFSKIRIHQESRSKELALAYANRSAVLFRFKKYKESLGDIDRALDLDYPDHLKPKLLLRKGVCLRALGEQDYEKLFEEAYQLMNRMSIPENMGEMNRLDEVRRQVEEKEYPVPTITSCNPEVPFASDAVAIKYDNIFGRHLVATRDIKAGETLIVEKPYELFLASEHMYSHCVKCLNIAWSSIPCDYCSYALFCSEKCKEDAWKQFHDIECPIIGLLQNLGMDTNLLSMRLIITLLRKMGSFQKLRKELEIVDNWKDPRTKGFSDGKFDNESYRSVYSLMTNTDKRSVPDLFKKTLNTAYILFFLATRTTMFGNKLEANFSALGKNPELTFVGGLILRHQQMMSTNFFKFGEDRKVEYILRGVAIMPFLSLINHSCDPNTVRQSKKAHMVVYALFPIKEGGQLFSNYVPFYGLLERDTRQKELKEQFFIDCHCRPCEENWPMYHELKPYRSLVTSPHQIENIRETLKNFMRYLNLITAGDLESEPDMLKNMYKMIEVLCESVPGPCAEIFHISGTIKRVIILEGNVFHVPEI